MRNSGEKRVHILLSTFNGEKYLAPQIESLLAQDYRHCAILVRDDGSSDGTPSLLRRYEKKFPRRIRVEIGNNIGVVQSFFRLLAGAPGDSSFYSFCDQDDVWRDDKISRAVERLESIPASLPGLYCSRVEYVDGELAYLGCSPLYRDTGFRHALFENIATGCTLVLNRHARELIVRGRSPELSKVVMHDWWCFLVVSAFGVIVFDDFAGVKYRQHAGNVIGGTQDRSREIMTHLRRLASRRVLFYRPHAQAREFLRCYGHDLEAGKRDMLERFLRSKASFLHRVGYALTGGIVRERLLDSLAVRALILLGWY